MDQIECKGIWERFITDGVLDSQLPSLIARSWQKCRTCGVDPWHREAVTASPEELQAILQKNRLLIQTAQPIMQSVLDIIRDSHFLLALTDDQGYVLLTMGDDTILARSENILFQRGAI